MYTLTKFAKSKWSLVIYKDNRLVFKSQAKALKPLIRYLKQSSPPKSKVMVFDKYVGRAAALLLSIVKPLKVYTVVISRGGRLALRSSKISFEAKKQVEYFMDVVSDDMCQWEKLAQKKTPPTFWRLVKNL